MTREEKVLVAVDVNNLWHSCQESHGHDYRVDFPNLIELVRSMGYVEVHRVLRLIAYVVEIPSKDSRSKVARNARFIEYLGKLGFEIQKRVMRYDKNKGKPYGTDWDVGITIDAIMLAHEYDTFTLVSGDGDFVILLNKLRDLGKRTEVITFEAATSRLLKEAADSTVFMTVDHVFQEPNLREKNANSA